jgi:hypothetical protein
MKPFDLTPRPFWRLLGVTCTLLGLIFAINPTRAASQASTNRPSDRNASIQAELDGMRRMALQGDPTKRPLVISGRASNRKDWLQKALTKGYAASGHTNAAWAENVRAAFAAYVDYSRASKWDVYTNLVRATSAAIKAGCDDPMIRYMDIRYRLADERPGEEPMALALLRAHEALMGSQYHPVLKFYSGWRAAETIASASPQADISMLNASTSIALEDLGRDTNAPVDEVFEAAGFWVNYSKGNTWMDSNFSDFEKIADRFWGREEPCIRFQGMIELERAWNSRGGGFANTVSDKGWEGFSDHLKKAERSLNTAWQMNSNSFQTAYLMMRLELGQGRGRAVMERWFERAMALDTNSFDAATLMSFYLEPRWYGSDYDCLDFARRCVASTNWGGRVPMVLETTHHSLARYYKKEDAPEYWHRTNVWADLQSSWEKFFKLNPQDAGWRHDYARDAYLCGQYKAFLEQTALFKYGTNFDYFGGEQKFKDMIKEASAARKTKE